MQYLSADNILNADDFAYAEVDCPEWGGTVRIRSLSGGQRVNIKKAIETLCLRVFMTTETQFITKKT